MQGKKRCRFDALVHKRLEDLPNIGKRCAEDFRAAGVKVPLHLASEDPRALYERICAHHCTRVDPCMLDVCMAAVAFVQGAPPTPWWFYTPERKRRYGALGAVKKRGG